MFSFSPVLPSTTSAPSPQKADIANSITEVLSHYGPWGYLMLGMLICGTVLMFCGLWECCFRRPKPHDDEPLQTPPTTVLIINQNDAGDARPPSYEELDQPPSYSVLFPNLKASDGDISGESGASACACANATEMSVLSDRNEGVAAETRVSSDLDANASEVGILSANASEVGDLGEINNRTSAEARDLTTLDINTSEISGVSERDLDAGVEDRDISVSNSHTSEIRVSNETDDVISVGTRDSKHVLNKTVNNNDVEISEAIVLGGNIDRQSAERS